MFPQPGMDCGFIERNDKVIGFALGCDATTEHEVGIKPLREAFGIGVEPPKGFWEKLFYRKPNPKFGIGARTATKTPLTAIFGEDSESFYLIVDGGSSYRQNMHPDVIRAIVRKAAFRSDWGIPSHPGKTVAAAWTDETFVIRVKAEHKATLEKFYKAIQDCKVALGFSRSNLTDIGGLCLYLVDNFPESEAKLWEKEERKETELREALKARWIKEGSDVVPKLKAAGLTWCYLGCDESSMKAGGKFAVSEDGHIRTWLNPDRQREFNCGWYTPTELRQWAEGKGPIIIPPEPVKNARARRQERRANG